ncbi:MAG: cytochrome c [Gammaproteobacteria bacterium]|nr:cytochrome c [Gammaproteobacteria bacterium]MCF6363332.1 cytochrome c [Gammaproteobacteria bacterium]
MRMLAIMAAILLGLTLLVGGTVQAADDKQLYDFYCAQCHGLTGKGDGPNVTKDFKTDPRDFTSVVDMEKLSDADIRNVIMDGGVAVSKSELMPPWSTTISEADVEKLTAYIRKLCKCTAKGK